MDQRKMHLEQNVLNGYLFKILLLGFLAYTPIVYGQAPTFNEIREFDNYIRKSGIHQTGAIHCNVVIDSLGNTRIIHLKDSYGNNFLSKIGYIEKLKSYKFNSRFIGYEIEYLYSLEVVESDDSSVNFKLIFEIMSSFFSDFDYSEYEIVDRYLIGNEKIIILPINLVGHR